MGKKQEQANNIMPSSNQREEKTSLMKNKKDIKDLIAPSGIDATSTDPVLGKKMALFGQKLITILTQPDDDTPSSENNK